MKTEEYLIASRAVQIELERLAGRIAELAQFRCAEPSNQVFLNVMARQSELLSELGNLHDRLAAGAKTLGRVPLA